jgi:hypothetical protein
MAWIHSHCTYLELARAMGSNFLRISGVAKGGTGHHEDEAGDLEGMKTHEGRVVLGMSSSSIYWKRATPSGCLQVLRRRRPQVA